MLRFSLILAALAIALAVAAGLTGGDGATVQAPAGRPPAGKASSARDETAGAASRTLVLEADGRGHFSVGGQVNGSDVTFLVDTGATAVVLGTDLAEQAGLNLTDHDFTGRASTANGIARTATVTVRSLVVGPISLWHVPVQVVDSRMGGMALLGMDFLKRLDSWDVRGERMVLRW
jgi:aspartyl protease family protein